MKLALSRVHFPVTTLGPGNRIGIWFQGCRIRCKGCISVDTWDESKGHTTVNDVSAAVTPWLPEADGVTISGGEPFDQPEALIELLGSLVLRPDQDVLVYSGYAIEQLASVLASCGGRIDALISDPFDEGAPQSLPLRGSDNQRLHFLTERGRRVFAKYSEIVTNDPPRLDVMFDASGTVWLAGIPRQGDMARLRAVLAERGHTAVIPGATNYVKSK